MKKRFEAAKTSLVHLHILPLFDCVLLLIIAHTNKDKKLLFIYRNCAGTQTIEFETFEVEPVKSSTTITKRMGWFKRLFWFALPVQFFLMVVLFLAWHSSDHHHGFYHFHGCDGSARFHFLYPQLKYINGPPPI